MKYQVVKTLAVHCHCDVCSAAGWHSAGCRTSWFCLQHHTTVVTSNGATICGSKFPPTVSPTSWQPLFTATAVYTLISLQAYQHTKIMSHKIYFDYVRPLATDTTSLIPKMSNCQHTAVYFNLAIPHLNVKITLFN